MLPISFSIVIPTLNEEENITNLLDSIAHQSYRQFEVLINDSGSKDRTKELVNSYASKLPKLTFIEYITQNVSGARNHGASLASYEWIVFFDADVTMESAFLQKMKDHIEQNNLDMCTVWNRPKPKNFRGSLVFGLMNIGISLLQKIKPAANGPCILMKKSLFQSIGGFDETIIFGEDYEIVRRAWKTTKHFAVFTTPYLFVSTRRFDKEGVALSLYKAITALLYQLFVGPVRKPLFKYEMGGQYYKKDKVP